MVHIEAQLLKHFAGVPFGSSQSKTAEILGTPDDKAELDAGDGSTAPVWHYWSKGFSVFFSNDDPDKFCCVEVDSSVLLSMLGVSIFKLNEHELKDLMRSSGYSEIEEENHEWGEKRITFDDANVDYYFEKGLMVSINFGALL